jgi:hypothetical protein
MTQCQCCFLLVLFIFCIFVPRKTRRPPLLFPTPLLTASPLPSLIIYPPGFRPDGRRYSLLDWLLRETEQVHGKIRRYTSPDEHAFFPEELPALVMPPIRYPQVRKANVFYKCALLNTPNVLTNILYHATVVYLANLLTTFALPT